MTSVTQTRVCCNSAGNTSLVRANHPIKGANFACSPDGRIAGVRLQEEVVAMLYSSSANAGFDLVTGLPLYFTPPKFALNPLPPAFSADGSKFAVAARDGTVSLWDLRNTHPLMVKEPSRQLHLVHSLQFSSGTSGREILALTEVSQPCLDVIFFMLNESA